MRPSSLGVARKVEQEARDRLADLEAEYYAFALAKLHESPPRTNAPPDDGVWEATHGAVLLCSTECAHFQSALIAILRQL